MISGCVAGIVFRIHAVFGTHSRGRSTPHSCLRQPLAPGPGSQVRLRSAVVVLNEIPASKSRKYRTSPVAPGRPARREFEYRRHGTVSLLAAMNVVDGTVLASIIERNDSVTFIGFLTEIDQMIDPRLDIHLIMDNGSSHTSKLTRAWLRAHPRFHVHYTPTHASWLNMIEIWFSILTRKVLRRGEFHSRQHLAEKIIEFACDYDDKAKPFRWTYDGRPLKAA